ncbi:MAG: TIGR03936 family radical SAM-associated protein [Actinomycetes bacterium]
MRSAKRGRLRCTSHRDIARALERALRRAQVPMAYSAGFSPHPKISWVGAAPTGVASEAEYVELGLAVAVDVERLRADLDASLPPGIDVLEVVEAPTGTSLPDRIVASHWRVRLPGVGDERAAAAVRAFLAEESVVVERLTKNGRRPLDARAAVVRLAVLGGGVDDAPDEASITHGDQRCATLDMVVRHVTPAVRPDDVLSGLRSVADLVPPVPPEATRLAQGPLTGPDEVGDPLAPDRDAAPSALGPTRQDAVPVGRDSAAGAQPPG